MIAKPTFKEVVYGVGVLLAAGMAWGQLNSKVNEQGALLKEIKPSDARLAVLEAKVDDIREDVKEIKRELRSRPR